MSTPIFLITPTGRAWRFLRRFSFRDRGGPCPVRPGGDYGHDARVEIEAGPLARDTDGHVITIDWPHTDPRWPAHCACGYAFQESDHWQCNQEGIYLAPDGRQYGIHPILRSDPRFAPPGALWEAPWYETFGVGPDGKHYMLRLPDGHDWQIDGPATNGGHWTRTGTAPRLTARPSILTPSYHGWLTDGVLSDDLEGRTYG